MCRAALDSISPAGILRDVRDITHLTDHLVCIERSPDRQERLTGRRPDVTYRPVCTSLPTGPMTRHATRSPKRRVRQPDITREKLLTAAFEEMYRRGFQAASLDTILAQAGVTKGALYHHFPDKAALGYAVVDEVVRGLLLDRWLGLLDPSEDP